MCGIFGILTTKDSHLTVLAMQGMIQYLFKLSESRGKEASGIAIHYDDSIFVFKSATSATRMVNSPVYRRTMADIFEIQHGASGDRKLNSPVAIMGHSRLVTNGTQKLNNNNQPVIKSGAVAIHNGIVVNNNFLWQSFPSLRRHYEVDSEIIPALLEKFGRESNSLVTATRETFKHIAGAASISVMFDHTRSIILATNTGSLYLCIDEPGGLCVFASERYILEVFARRWRGKEISNQFQISQVKPGSGYLMGLDHMSVNEFKLDDDAVPHFDNKLCTTQGVKIIDLSPNDRQDLTISGTAKPVNYRDFEREYTKFELAIAKLRRCTRCILPETMPFIEFDENGVCNYCRNYQKAKVEGEESLEKFIAKYRRTDGKPDCVVTFSGGRDSSYTLHYIKKILKLNPIAYSYDWGMITDLARRNQARLCGKLGIEHILVSADITQKRRYIRQNVLTWMKNPALGLVPLFMAGDKQFLYYANKIGKQSDVKLIISGSNLLEKTDFKSGFCGVAPMYDYTPGKFHLLPVLDRAKLISYYGRQYISNPGYINASLYDTLFAFFSYYLQPHNFCNIYRYIQWDENNIISTLRDLYDWEIAKDTNSTWRIGDGTASFYNYIYYVLAGFTENDTFRSNQIREGQLSRKDAMALVREANRPRYCSIIWYCDTIGIDFEFTLKSINCMRKLYKL